MQTKLVSPQPSEYHAWSRLSTVTSFDPGSTVPVGMADNGLALKEVDRFSPISLLIESLVEQLCKLLARTPRQRKKLYNVICQKLHQMNLIDQSYNVEEFEFMRSHYQRALFHLLTVAKSVTTISTSDNSVLLQLPRHNLTAVDTLLSSDWSRYSTEYEELEYIARGGFGRVYKARNKLDGVEYAIKKICLQKCDKCSSTDDSSSIVFKNSDSKSISKEERNNHTSISETEHIGFYQQHSKITSLTTSHESSFTTDDSDVSVDKVLVKYRRASEHMVNFWKLKNAPIQQDWAMLYVQMQLCERTLKEWLDCRNAQTPPSSGVDIKQSVAIFQQIVSGVCYIHSQNIVHHDIKPSNIFVNNSLTQVQVGDFGLACCLQHSPNDVTLVAQSPADVSTRHKGEIGTKMYAAPEQLRGKCNPKSDLYSLGIVLFELLQPFNTDMERVKVISKLKTGHIPPELTVRAPKLAQLISRLVSKSPTDRPLAEELSTILVPLSKETNEAKNVDSKNETIQQLLAVISQREREIEELKQQLQLLQTGGSKK